MLLIHHDQGELGERRENGGAGADDDAGGAAMCRAPGIAALVVRKTRVHDGHAGAETAAESIEQLRRQGNLGHQNQSLAAGCYGGSDDAQVHLGLAAAGHAVQQVHGKGRERGEYRLDGCILVPM